MPKKDKKQDYSHTTTTVRLGNLTDIRQEDRTSLGFIGGSNLDDNCM